MRKAIPITATAVVLWVFLAFTQNAFLFKNGDLSLFLFDWTFFKESFMIPGGFLGWAGSFFTQFLIIPWLGALLWVLLLVAAGILTVKVFNIPSRLVTLATLPVAILIIANMSLGYAIYIMRAQDYFFAPTLGYIFMLAIMKVTWVAPKTWEKVVILTISAFIGFILVGVFALAGVIAASLGLIAQCRNINRFALPAFAIILCIVVPFCVIGLFTSYRMIDSWYLGLPTLGTKAWTKHIRIPYWILFGMTAAFASLRHLFANPDCNRKGMTAAHIGIGVIAIAATSLFWFKDSNFKTELGMEQAAEQFDWQKVTDIYRKASLNNVEEEKKVSQKMREELKQAKDDYSYEQILTKYEDRFFKPTRLMAVLRDLALLKQGKALDQAFTFRDGSKPQKTFEQINMSIQDGPQLYLNYGLVNMSYRWCLENHVMYGWSFHTLRYMAMHAILMNETEFADKFLSKLDKTLFYRKWSKSQRSLAKDAKAMAATFPYNGILPYMDFGDHLAMEDNNTESYLLHHFSDDRDIKSSPEFDSAALLWAMRSKDTGLFWKTFALYAATSPEDRLPIHVQEAALLYNSLEKENLGIPFDKKVLDNYAAFLKLMQQSRYRSENEAEFPIWLKFGNTFFYYYYFIHDIQSF